MNISQSSRLERSRSSLKETEALSGSQKGRTHWIFHGKWPSFIITIESRSSYPICAEQMVNVQSGPGTPGRNFLHNSRRRTPRPFWRALKIGKTRPSLESKGGTFSLSCNTKYCPFSPPTSWALLLSTCHESSTWILSRESWNRKTETREESSQMQQPSHKCRTFLRPP